LGKHRLLCGDARDPACYAQLLGGRPVDLVFTDPPYNVPINGHVSGNGRVRQWLDELMAGTATNVKTAPAP
jgi:DNA modification methylase